MGAPKSLSNSTADQIMDIAEQLIRSRGYYGFAFREIASAVGIKSASVHYHFPTKGDLTEAVMNRYVDRFRGALNAVDEQYDSAFDKIEQYISMYRSEISKEKTMSLCMVLSVNIDALPAEVLSLLNSFFEVNNQWLARVIQAKSPGVNIRAAKNQAAFLLAAFNGALLAARALNDIEHFNRVAKQIIQQFKD